ncbi:MAG: family 1 glycosylhydrolase [Waddliaceae bacterium]
MFQKINSTIWHSIENHFIPPPPDSNKSRAWRYTVGALMLPLGLTTVSITSIISCAGKCFCCCRKDDDRDPNDDFTVVLKDSRKWKLIEDPEKKIDFKANILFGVATCTYQDSGSKNCPDSQWADWEKEILPVERRSGASANLFGLYQSQEGYKEITDRLHRLGVNSYRFSIEWSHIEPEEGRFDEEKLKIYVAFCKHLREEGISPMITLHHFSEPKWFHKKGGFENEDNIKCFLDFVEYVFPHLTQSYNEKPLVEYFCTINEPAGDAFSKYIRGAHPPGAKLRFKRAGLFLKGALKAHGLAYSKLKAIAPDVKIGIIHSYSPVIAKNTVVYPIARNLTRLINDTALNFFRTGVFDYKIPLSCNIQEAFDFGTDFIGLQFYARTLIGLTGSTSYHEPMTEMPYREDPEGLYEAVVETYKAANKPIIITENGISTRDPKQRSRYMGRALYAANQAKNSIGEENLQGYYCWTFTDNFEWSFGMGRQPFGLFSLDEGNIASTPKEGAESFIAIISSDTGEGKSGKEEI